MDRVMRRYLSPDSSSFVKLPVRVSRSQPLRREGFSVVNKMGPVTHGWREKFSKTTHHPTIPHPGKPSRQIEAIENRPRMTGWVH